jgi:hypothetical protein
MGESDEMRYNLQEKLARIERRFRELEGERESALDRGMSARNVNGQFAELAAEKRGILEQLTLPSEGPKTLDMLESEPTVDLPLSDDVVRGHEGEPEGAPEAPPAEKTKRRGSTSGQDSVITEIENIANKHAVKAGSEIPTLPDTRHTLLVDSNVYRGEELKQDIKGYLTSDGRHIGAAERFYLEEVNTSDVSNIMAHVKDPARTVVQVSRELTKDELTELNAKAPGIRMIRVDTTYFRNEKLNAVERRDCRFDLYAMMLLARQVTQEDRIANTSIYQSLVFMLNTHYGNGEEVMSDEYIEAILKGDLEGMSFIIKHNLSYRPAGRWRVPDYHTIAVTLISA